MFYLIQCQSNDFLNMMVRLGGRKNVCHSRKLKSFISFELNLIYVYKKGWHKLCIKCHYILEGNYISFVNCMGNKIKGVKIYLSVTKSLPRYEANQGYRTKDTGHRTQDTGHRTLFLDIKWRGGVDHVPKVLRHFLPFFLCFFPVICMQQFKRRNIVTLICIPKSLWFPALSALIALKCTRHVLCYRICQNGCHRASLSATWHQCLQQCISVCNRASLFAIGLQCMQHSITVCNIASVSATVHHCLQHSITVCNIASLSAT